MIQDIIITKISAEPIPPNKSANTTIIDGKGKFLMPGLIDAHSHIMFESLQQVMGMTAEYAHIALFQSQDSEKYLFICFFIGISTLINEID